MIPVQSITQSNFTPSQVHPGDVSHLSSFVSLSRRLWFKTPTSLVIAEKRGWTWHQPADRFRWNPWDGGFSRPYPWLSTRWLQRDHPCKAIMFVPTGGQPWLHQFLGPAPHRTKAPQEAWTQFRCTHPFGGFSLGSAELHGVLLNSVKKPWYLMIL